MMKNNRGFEKKKEILAAAGEKDGTAIIAALKRKGIRISAFLSLEACGNCITVYTTLGTITLDLKNPSPQTQGDTHISVP
jgi:hypothetical protein